MKMQLLTSRSRFLGGMIILAFISFFSGIFLADSVRRCTVFISPDRRCYAVISADDFGPQVTILLLRIYEISSGEFGEYHRLILAADTGSSARMKWTLKWISNDIIELDSSDTGVTRWERDERRAWKRFPEWDPPKSTLFWQP